MARVLVDWLVERYPAAKRQTLKRMVQERRVLINGKTAGKLKQALADSDDVRVVGRAPAAAKRADPRLRIVYEDDDLMVVDKPPGLLTSTVAGERRATLLELARQHLAASPARVGVVHRLDREARGLLVMSKNDEAHRDLKRQFFHHTVQRVYAAAVEGAAPKKGRIDSRLVEYADGSVHTTLAAGKGRRAVTEFELVRRSGRRALLRVTLLTGRKHQIRAHLAEGGVPVVGDSVYGTKHDSAEPLMLAAVHLAFAHPRTGRPMVFDLPVPQDMERAVP